MTGKFAIARRSHATAGTDDHHDGEMVRLVTGFKRDFVYRSSMHLTHGGQSVKTWLCIRLISEP